ncbi:hypothetical protein P171DRAFT_489849 [Karstenula rhodostoma CBS 690.94]|uniref:Uncharacterized protein n=1 Tax=Karstenula rhodostoma CBS 690.94 TaxID=1392251 RepID=A0A9P4P9Q0_9PLEO|nr:hypothetical protein P171DRAFT_489849 [Karstenula rhodostoma CBS 690.94]
MAPGAHAADLLTHARMYAIADRLLVTGLKALAAAEFRLACLHFWKEPEFGLAAEYVFLSTPDEDKSLRSLVCKTIAEHSELVKDEKVDYLLKEHKGFAYDLLQEKVVKMGGV